MNLQTGKKLTRRRWIELPMPQEVTDRVNKLGEADEHPSLLTFYYRHGNLVGDTVNTNADLTEAPEEETEENEPVPDITGVDQEPPDNEQQDLKTPDENQNDNDINYRTEEIGDPTEETFQINDDLQPQGKEPEHPLDTPVPVTWRSTCLKKPVNLIIPSFEGMIRLTGFFRRVERRVAGTGVSSGCSGSFPWGCRS